jgi:uncharacterized protein (UPF0303 family)
MTALVAALEQQERELVLASFTYDDAWRLGNLLITLARERGLGITVDIRKGTQQVFHAALEGTSADNDAWVERKAAVAYRYGASSFLVRQRHAAQGLDFHVATGLPLSRFAAHGGAVPIRVAGVGVVGVVTVSGLAQEDDHVLVVEALRIFASGSAAH